MKRRLPNKHDKIVKDTFSNPEIAKAYFSEFLPDALKDVIDFNSMTYVDGSFIQEEFKEFFSDLLFQFKVKNSNKDLIVSLLFEHKAYPDKHVLIQIGNYIFNQWVKESKSKQKIVPIIPFIYYQGKKKWIIPSIGDLFEGYPVSVMQYIPSFDFIYLAINSLSYQQLEDITDTMLYIALSGHDPRQDIGDFLEKVAKILSLKHLDDNDWNFVIGIFVYKLTNTDTPKEEIKTIIKSLPKPINTKLMSTYEAIKIEGKAEGRLEGKAEGRLEGKAEGRVEGKAEGRLEGKAEVVLALYNDKISIRQIQKYTKLSEETILEILKNNIKF